MAVIIVNNMNTVKNVVLPPPSLVLASGGPGCLLSGQLVLLLTEPSFDAPEFIDWDDGEAADADDEPPEVDDEDDPFEILSFAFAEQSNLVILSHMLAVHSCLRLSKPFEQRLTAAHQVHSRFAAAFEHNSHVSYWLHVGKALR